MHNEYDVVIVGGGIVGMSLSLILSQSFNVALVEKNSNTIDPAGRRTIVLSHSTRLIFESMGVWEQLEKMVCPIYKIEVSDQGHFGGAHITAEEEYLPALGYVLQASDIEASLRAQVIDNTNIALIQPGNFHSYTYSNDKVFIQIEHDEKIQTLCAKLLVAADGQNSAIRKYSGIRVTKKDYQQTAIISNIHLKRSHQNIAYERFTPEGPLAVLPLLGNKAAVIWTMSQERAKRLLALSDQDFRAKLQHGIGYRVGKIETHSSPIGINVQLITADSQTAPGVVLLGNAMHTLHPVAGQGLNLSMRDMAVLAEILHLAKQNHKLLGSLETMQQYVDLRKKDQQQIIVMTHSLVGVFSNSLLPVVLARDFGMIMLDRFKGLKKLLTKRSLGFAGKVPRLACGMTLE